MVQTPNVRLRLTESRPKSYVATFGAPPHPILIQIRITRGEVSWRSFRIRARTTSDLYTLISLCLSTVRYVSISLPRSFQMPGVQFDPP
jgi:hypothetical protein